MSRFFQGLVLGSMLVTIGATGASAKSALHDPAAALTTKALGGVSAPNARLAALIGPGAAPSFVYRSKGVAQVTHPSVGNWCIKPSFSVNVNAVIPVLTVDWPRSSGPFGEMAQTGGNTGVCPAGTIAVSTFEQDADTSSPTFGTFIFSDQVAFDIVVP